ncbi:MAG: SPOR domain-containing protein [Dysgonamonadaceae bacterium]|nr:SPOR domain-containing protein [Dysgonamonadaceae bacterium]
MEAQNIISELETSKAGEGTIRVVCDAEINALLGTPAVSSHPSESGLAPGDESVTKVVGYRIQIYMDNSPKAKNEAIRIENLFNETFPEIGVYVIYNAPNWKVVVGDFRTREEAVILQHTIQSSLPELGKEMYIIPSRINLPVQK